MQDAELVPIQASHYMEALLEVGQVPHALDVLMKVRRLVPDAPYTRNALSSS